MSSQVPGHGLVGEGKAFPSDTCDECLWQKPRPFMQGVSGWGHGRCSCGIESGHLSGGNARKRWHKDHKEQMRMMREKMERSDALAERIKAALRMLLDSGDITPTAQRMITKIVEEEMGAPTQNSDGANE